MDFQLRAKHESNEWPWYMLRTVFWSASKRKQKPHADTTDRRTEDQVYGYTKREIRKAMNRKSTDRREWGDRRTNNTQRSTDAEYPTHHQFQQNCTKTQCPKKNKKQSQGHASNAKTSLGDKNSNVVNIPFSNEVSMRTCKARQKWKKRRKETWRHKAYNNDNKVISKYVV